MSHHQGPDEPTSRTDSISTTAAHASRIAVHVNSISGTSQLDSRAASGHDPVSARRSRHPLMGLLSESQSAETVIGVTEIVMRETEIGVAEIVMRETEIGVKDMKTDIVMREIETVEKEQTEAGVTGK
jgi:hypothetical protein